MKFIFELSHKRSGQEMITSNDRLHFAVKAKMTAYLRYLASLEVKRQFDKFKPVFNKTLFDKKHPCGVTITVLSPTNRRFDADNVQPTAKALMDGMTDAGLWTDDNNKVVKFTKYQYGGLSGTDKFRLILNVEAMKGE